jgi:dGTPase
VSGVPRLAREALERTLLCPRATFSAEGEATRERAEAPCPVRTAFQRDCHRVVHGKAWRRLRGKTQVFLWPKGDHYRTRLTHCQEVSQVARTLARGLRLNEDLAEAIALGHDLGHSPFGHAGEATLQKLCPGGFRHEAQSLRVVERLEHDGRGLNLTAQVRDGIARHSKGTGPILALPAERLPATPEGQIVRLSDLIAYVNHDVDDALRAGVIEPGDVPALPGGGPGASRSERLTALVLDVLAHTDLERDPVVRMSPEAAAGLEDLRAFLHARVYYNPQVHAEFHKAADLLERLWHFFLDDLDRFYELWPGALRDGTPEDDVRDFLAGMTDAYAVELHDRLFTPRRWTVY